MDQNDDNMPETKLSEALSALMDGEGGDLELRRILRDIPEHPELYAVWKRYHAVRASLNQELHANPRVDLLLGVQARLAAEQQAEGFTPQGMQQNKALGSVLRSRVLRYVGQGAIAASVAAAALIGVSLLEVNNKEAGSEFAPALADAGVSPTLNGEFNALEQSRTVALDAETYDRLQQAVYREFSGSPAQIPVSYTPAFPAELQPAD